MTDIIKPYDVMILSGGFDPVHKGHIQMFREAKNFATVVIVGLNSDAWLTRKKGKPFMQWGERAAIIDSVRYVDKVLAFNDDDGTASSLIQHVHNTAAAMLDTTFLLHNGKSVSRPLRIAFGNGGDRSKQGSIPSAEEQLCKLLGVDLIGGVGGEDKVQSSSWLINASRTQ